MKKVLLVEDDPRVASAISIALRAMGYEVLTASDAVLAIAQARRGQPDVVVLDINLPGGDGFMVAQRLKNLAQTATVPIIVITASKQTGMRERAMEAGAMHFLEKPFGVTDLADAIEMAHSVVDTSMTDMQIG
ncbi:MAG: response regulator [Gammaproteobacteria bacterium]